VICGLGTWTHTTLQTQPYFVKAICSENPPSSVSITISQSGSASVSVTSPAPTTAQGAITLSKQFNCVAGDILTVTLSSAAPIDNQLNTVETTVVVFAGPGQ